MANNKLLQLRKIKIKTIFYIIILISTFLYLFIPFYKNHLLFGNGKFTNAHIYDIRYGSSRGGRIVIDYFFIVNGKRYYDGLDVWLDYSVRNRLLNKEFPMIYDSTNPKRNLLLIGKVSWEKLEHSMPDSLTWIKKYYR